MWTIIGLLPNVAAMLCTVEALIIQQVTPRVSVLLGGVLLAASFGRGCAWNSTTFSPQRSPHFADPKGSTLVPCCAGGSSLHGERVSEQVCKSGGGTVRVEFVSVCVCVGVLVCLCVRVCESVSV